MSLLILVSLVQFVIDFIFTFHYVTINSFFFCVAWYHPPFFTFHYVTINSRVRRADQAFPGNFTFHYVTINSCERMREDLQEESLHSTMSLLIQDKIYQAAVWFHLYIPLCHY